MGFDFVTFLAQIVNLAVLVWLLKRFLYQPIIKAVDARQTYIHQRIKEADTEKEKWEKESLALSQTRADFEQSKKELWAKTLEEQKDFLKKQQEELKNERLRGVQQIKEDLTAQKESLVRQIQTVAGESVIDLMKRLARDFALESDIENNIALFEKALKKIPLSERKEMQEALDNGEKIIIFSALKLSQSQKDSIKQLLEKVFKAPLPAIGFKQNEALIFGFRLQIGHLTADWNIQTYFADMEHQFNTQSAHLIEETSL